VIPEFMFALVPAGEFLIGSEQGQDDQHTIHRVRVERSEESRSAHFHEHTKFFVVRQ